MHYRPFRWYGTSEIESLSKALQEKLANWALHWGIHGEETSVAPQIHIAQGEDLKAYSGLLESALGVSDGLSQVRVVGSPGLQTLLTTESQHLLPELLLRRALTSEAIAHPLSQEILTKALNDVANHLSAGRAADVVVGKEIFARASGWTLVKANWSKLNIFVLIAPQILANWLPLKQPRTALDRQHSAKETFKNLTASLTAELSPVTLSIGEISSLAVGDVVRLQHAVITPVYVKTAAGGILCRAILGKKDERRALQLASGNGN